jgi:cell division protein FtsQ
MERLKRRKPRSTQRNSPAQEDGEGRMARLPRRAAAGAFSALMLTVALVAAAPYAAQWVRSHPYFLLQTIDVHGNRRLSKEAILEHIAVRVGESIWNFSARNLQMRLNAHPWIQRATVERELPARVVIRVTERNPIAIVRFEELHFVDRRGHVLGPLGPEDSRDLPIITGLEEGANRAFAPVALPRMAQLLRWCERRRCIDDMSEVHIDRENGVTMFPMAANVAVQLGWGRWSEKLKRSARVFAAWKGQLDRLASIDVSLAGMVVVRVREGNAPAQTVVTRGRKV